MPATKDGAVFAPWTMDEDSVWSEGQYIEPNCTCERHRQLHE